MEFYYCYQQKQQAQPEPQPPQSTPPELNTPLPSFFLLSPRPTLPLLTPILPSASMATTVATSEYNELQQLPTPNTFIRHCEDMGLFHDLQNVVVVSPVDRSFDDTVATTVTASTATAITSNKTFTTATLATSASTENPSSNSFGSLSTTVLKTMTMANPFDETFKRAMLQQEKKDSILVEDHFNNNNNNNNNNDDELNTPFIATSTDLESTKVYHYTSANEVASDLVTASTIVEPITISSIDPQQINLNIVPSTTEICKFKVNTSASFSRVLVTMVDQKKPQQSCSIISSQNHLKNHCISKKRIIESATMMTNNVVNTTATNFECQNLKDHDIGSDDESSSKFISIGSESTKVKQVLKQNLLEKQMLQEHLLPPILSKNQMFNNIQQEKNGVDIVSTTTVEQDSETCNSKDEIKKNQMIEQRKKKQEQLERNRTAAKRSRLKRKEKWELLSEENRRLRIENIRLLKIISKITGHKKIDLPE